MIEQIEQIALRSLLDAYPHHSSMTKHLVAIGDGLQAKKTHSLASWHTLQQKRTFLRFISMTYILAQNKAYVEWITRIEADATWCFINCYFESITEEARPYFIALYYPRYCWQVLRGMLQSLSCWKPKPEGHSLNQYELDYLVLSLEQSSR